MTEQEIVTRLREITELIWESNCMDEVDALDREADALEQKLHPDTREAE